MKMRTTITMIMGMTTMITMTMEAATMTTTMITTTMGFNRASLKMR